MEVVGENMPILGEKFVEDISQLSISDYLYFICADGDPYELTDEEEEESEVVYIHEKISNFGFSC